MPSASSASTQKNRTKSKKTPLSADEDNARVNAPKHKTTYRDLGRRREQNRVNAQKSYYRKLNVLEVLRAEVATLETSYKTQMRALKHADNGDDGIHDDTMTVIHSSSDFRYRLQQLAAVHDELRNEHRALRKLHDLHVKFQCRVQLLVDSEHVAYDDAQRRARVLRDFRVRCPVRMKRPLTVDECYDIGREVYAKIVTFSEGENYNSTGGAVCGWADQRRVDDNLLKFSLQKVFPNITTHEIAARTWPVLASPEKLQTFYSPSMKMHCEVAQRVDENNVVIYQEYEAKESENTVVLVRSILLITLFEIENGYVMVFYGLDPERLHERDEKDVLASVGITDRKVWLDKFSWCIWQEHGSNGENVNGAFVGAVPAHGASSRYWSAEVLLLSLKWEHEVIGPNFILRGEDNPEPREDLDLDALMETTATTTATADGWDPPTFSSLEARESGSRVEQVDSSSTWMQQPPLMFSC
ncbi:hypothetical protein FI667_g15095, partial [Globisporangium splendens]